MNTLWKSQADALASACLSQFGDLSTYRPKLGVAWEMELIYRESSADEEIAAPGVYTIAFGKAIAFLYYPQIGDTISYHTKNYYVYRIDADGQGGIDLMLRETK